jgi:hypothetical protein
MPLTCHQLFRPLLTLSSICGVVAWVALGTRATGSEAPPLSIARSNNDVVLSWPATATGFSLQTAPSPDKAASWTEIQGNPVVLGTDFVWANPLLEGERYFRLFQAAALPVPTSALFGTVASVGIPWVVTTDAEGPAAPIPGTGWGSVPRIVSFANRDGSLDVAWTDMRPTPQIIITHLVPEAAGYKLGWHLKVHTLSYLGGFARDEAGNMFFLTTVAEDLLAKPAPNGVHRPNIAHLVKLGPLGNELFRTDLRTDVQWAGATPLYSPMSWGTGRVAVGSGRVMMALAANTEWDPPVNSRHQFHIYFGVNATTGALESYSELFGHSWDHRLIHHAGQFLGTSLGDAGLRGIGVAVAGAGWHKVAFAIKGGDATTVPFYQNTFSRLGDLAPGAAGYGLLFASEKSAVYTGGTSAVISSRNLAFVHVRSDFDQVVGDPANMYDVAIVDTTAGNPAAQTFDVPIKDYWGDTFAGKNKGIVWLTNYSNRATENVERPKLVALGDGRFMALWERWTLTAYSGTFAAVIDEYGHVTKGPSSLGIGVRLHRQDSAVQLGNKAAWVVGETTGVPKLVLYTVDPDLKLTRTEIK